MLSHNSTAIINTVIIHESKKLQNPFSAQAISFVKSLITEMGIVHNKGFIENFLEYLLRTVKHEKNYIRK